MPSELPLLTGEIPDSLAIAGLVGWLLGMFTMWLMQRELRRFGEKGKG